MDGVICATFLALITAVAEIVIECILKYILIGNSPLSWSYFLSVNLERCNF